MRVNLCSLLGVVVQQHIDPPLLCLGNEVEMELHRRTQLLYFLWNRKPRSVVMETEFLICCYGDRVPLMEQTERREKKEGRTVLGF